MNTSNNLYDRITLLLLTNAQINKYTENRHKQTRNIQEYEDLSLARKISAI